jgi:hypothetical protein
MSNTPHASPPQKMARNALFDETVAVEAAEAEGIEHSFENGQILRQHRRIDAPNSESSLAIVQISWSGE